ncbi:hypothetical protein PIB30_075096 [Stylosanthes scabra]|uniref:Uncharacterized protein n=1 Tax=Stylosanthes scabra TaxID=79078 RepID=A0ABU6SQE9_9FABA|nr:hypothetical protein [Stylosanthes scabra]
MGGLESFQPIPAFECTPKCSYGLGIIRAYRCEGYVVKFLRGLNDQFSTIRSQVFVRKNSSKGSNSAKTDVGTANRQGKGRGKPYGGRGKLVCTYCGKLATDDDNYEENSADPKQQKVENQGLELRLGVHSRSKDHFTCPSSAQ